jgi:hypothetical protein
LRASGSSPLSRARARSRSLLSTVNIRKRSRNARKIFSYVHLGLFRSLVSASRLRCNCSLQLISCAKPPWTRTTRPRAHKGDRRGHRRREAAVSFRGNRNAISDLSLFRFAGQIIARLHQDRSYLLPSVARVRASFLPADRCTCRTPRKGSERDLQGYTVARALFVQLNYLHGIHGPRNSKLGNSPESPEEKTPRRIAAISMRPCVLPAFLLSSIEDETSSRRSCRCIGGRTGGDLNWKVPRCVTCHRERC